MTTDIVLPPICFDLLEASIRKYGIGAGRYYTFSPTEHGVPGDWIPCCFMGHFEDCFGSTRILGERFGVGEISSDRAVRAINTRMNRKPDIRVTWEEFRDEMRLVRGGAQSCDVSAHDSSIRQNARPPADLSRLAEQPIQ